MSLKSAAEAHIQSYADTFATFIASNDHKTANPSSSPSPSSPAATLSTQMTSHYHYPFTSFTLGQTHTIPSQPAMHLASTPYLSNWLKHGLLKFKLATNPPPRVEVLSPTNAICWVTWEMGDGEADDGRGGWRWENVYVYRMGAGMAEEGGAGGQVGGFEAVFSDNEILGLMQHAPEVLQGLSGSEEEEAS